MTYNVPYSRTKEMKYQVEDVEVKEVVVDDELRGVDKKRKTYLYASVYGKHFLEFLGPRHEQHLSSSFVLDLEECCQCLNMDQALVPNES